MILRRGSNALRLIAVCTGLVLLMPGCQSLQPRDLAGDEVAAQPALKLPFAEPEPARRELDEDLVFSYLVGEIGAHRGELRLSQSHYQHAAILARDAYAAERATRIALHLKDYQAGLAAARRWVELAPNDMSARQLAAVLFMRDQQQDAAAEQLDALVLIADARNVDGYLQAAGALSVESDRAAAEQLMLGLHERNRDDVRSLYALAVLEAAHRNFGQAETRLREVIERKPDWDQPRVLLARVLVAQSRRGDALAFLDDSVRRYPDAEAVRTTYARMLVDDSEYAKALEQFRELYRRNPDDDELAFGYAMLATQQEAWDEARPVWQALRNDAERRDEASYYLAQVEERVGNDDLAIGLFGAVSGGDLKIDAVMRKAQILGRTGRLEQARDTLQQARIANPGRAADLYIAETQLVQKHGPSEVALALYDDALRAFDENHDLRYNRALFVLELGDFEGMERELRHILDQDPDNVDALNALGYTLADRNERLDEAFTLVARALKLKPDNPAILDSMGWVFYRQGNLSEAASYLRRALELTNDDEIAAHLGEVLWMKGQREDAQAVWREALEHKPGSDKIRAVIERLQAASQ
ncbi:MAG: tetratricopeptide repeat protein [Gammaproteobacteria bacterium]|nr:tetratricopeptide repeat protein [Gammaproteobacteria bacterium]